jgi:hypothetical protein
MKTFIMSALMSALLLGCSYAPGTEVEQIKLRAAQLCGYQDRIGAIAKIVAAANAVNYPAGVVMVSGVDATATAICNAIKAHEESKVATAWTDCPRVNGVCVK